MPARYTRILLKLSGEALAGDREYGISPDVARYIASEVSQARALGVQVGIVIGGGNIFRGVAGTLDGIPRTLGDSIGMLATVINSLTLRAFFQKDGIPTKVYGSLAIDKTVEPFVSERAIDDLQKGTVVIIAGGTGNPYFTTDTAAALRCAEIEAQVLLKATKVDGVYDRDPIKDNSATKFDSISYSEALSRKLRVMDLTAMSLCMENDIPIIVFKLMEPGNLGKCLEGNPVGSRISKEA